MNSLTFSAKCNYRETLHSLFGGSVCFLFVPQDLQPVSVPGFVYRFNQQMSASRPASFTCIVSGDAVTRSLARIPQDAGRGSQSCEPGIGER